MPINFGGVIRKLMKKNRNHCKTKLGWIKKVDEYIEKQKSPQKEICNKSRKLIFKTFPDIKEEIKMGVPGYEGKLYETLKILFFEGNR